MSPSWRSTVPAIWARDSWRSKWRPSRHCRRTSPLPTSRAAHFLISVIGNYERQEPTPAQLAAIADMMAWALRTFDLPLERIGGHYNYATTGCPGQHLRKHLENGTLRRMVAARLR